MSKSSLRCGALPLDEMDSSIKPVCVSLANQSRAVSTGIEFAGRAMISYCEYHMATLDLLQPHVSCMAVSDNQPRIWHFRLPQCAQAHDVMPFPKKLFKMSWQHTASCTGRGNAGDPLLFSGVLVHWGGLGRLTVTAGRCHAGSSNDTGPFVPDRRPARFVPACSCCICDEAAGWFKHCLEWP